MEFLKIKVISTLFYVVFILLMAVTFRNYFIEKQRDAVNINIVNTKQFIKNSIDYLITEKKKTYITAAKIIFSDSKVLSSLDNKNRTQFYNNIKHYYERAHKRDESFWGLHIILPDNMSFIRVHKPHVADKYIKIGKKPLIDKVNATHQKIISFDDGKFGYFLRVVTPIFSTKEKYLGVAEFSVNVDSLTQDIKKSFGYESLFLVKNIKNKEFLNNLPKTPDGLVIFKSTDKDVFSKYNLHPSKVNISENQKNFIHSNNQDFSTISITLSKTATLIVAFEVTNIIKEQKLFEKNVTSLISLVIIVFSLIWFFATKLYINSKRQIASQLQKSHDIISENVIFSNTDLNGVITEVSNACCQVSKYKREELIGSTHGILIHPDMKNFTYKDIFTTIKNNKTWVGEVKNINNKGEPYWVNTTISPKLDENNHTIGYMLIMQDITYNKMIEAISITDGLCGIYNRRHFDDIFPKIINSSKRNNELICFFIMDVDYFKKYNDTYGHQMGDKALVSIANCLKDSLHRGDDLCFRLGGEEFGVIFKATDAQMAFEFTDKIRTYIEDLKIIHTGNDVSKYITASFGIICKNANDIKDIDEIYKEADSLLYRAKESSRNKVIINN